MTDFFRICCIIALGSALLLIFAEKERELMSLLSALLLVSLILYTVTRLGGMMSPLKELLKKALPQYADIFLPICGITLGGTAAAALCDCVGQKSMGTFLEFLTVLELLFLAAEPIANTLKITLTFLADL